ncbi:TldD/PmbA family protein [Clostridium sp. BJN0001]|uniref:TldD/PmbA family protein n=1 Tax=Clostridium sp. BJN0001 TaxID=2930219 RepID=UPI001FD06C31|nr:TldD/PmbA family protein [Clostridium sp. BJN0001]
MELELFTKKLFKKAIENGFNEYEVYYMDSESMSINVYEGEVEKYKMNKSFGLSFRGKINGKMGYSYTEIADDAAIDMLIKNAKSAALAIENEDKQFIYEGDKEYKKLNTYNDSLDEIHSDKLISLAINMEKECRKLSDKIVSFGGCTAGYGKASYGIINSKGLNLKNRDNSLSAYVIPIVSDGKDKFDGIGYRIEDDIEKIDPKEVAKEAVNDALSRIGGKSVPSSKYKIIVNNEAMSSLLSTFCSVFNSENVQKGLSLLKDKEGEKVASNIVTLVDDPHLEGGLSSTPFDDEGVATFSKEIIKNGTLKTFLYNLKTASKANVKSTGNGFKSSYASTIGISPSNMYIKKGNKGFDQLLKEIDNGLIITEFNGLHSGANAITGEFSLAAKGFVVSHGKKGRPVQQITVAGNFFDFLKNITDIGNDLKFPMSSIGSPSVIVEGLSVAGK